MIRNTILYPYTLIVSIFMPFLLVDLQAQSSDTLQIRTVIDELFDAMRANDSTGVHDLFIPEAQMSTIMVDQSGETVKRTNPYGRFVTAMGTPHESTYDEQIWSYDIQIDGPMAYAWTEYTFYLGIQMLHCGVNMFELIKTSEGWRISSVVDTRRKTGCQSNPEYDIHNLLNSWHRAAAEADEDVFFGLMAEDGIYIGTDATERWTRDEMLELMLPYFQRETAWDFTPLERNVVFNDDKDLAWFDELLDTWMGTCRSSGVMIATQDGWRIQHYHLSIAVPNDKVDGYLDLIGLERKK